jgi:hypothetical protein
MSTGKRTVSERSSQAYNFFNIQREMPEKNMKLHKDYLLNLQWSRTVLA